MWRWNKELESGFYYQLLEKGFIKPEDQEPDVTGLDFFLESFREISTARPIGLEVGPIPFTAIVDYARLFEVPDFDGFFQLMRRLDRVFLELNREENSKKKAKNTPAPKKGGSLNGKRGS